MEIQLMNYRMEYTKEAMTELTMAYSIKKFSMFFHEIAVVFILLAGTFYFLTDIKISIIMLLLAAVVEVMRIFQKKKLLEVSLGQFDTNSNGTGMIKNELHFGKTSVVIKNLVSGETIEIPYDKFKEYTESENYFMAITKYNQFIAVSKEEAVRDRLKEYLMARVEMKKC